MKKEWGFEKYLIDLNYYQRSALAKFRCRSNYLPVSKTRFQPLTDEELHCPLCDTNETGDEFHYLINCEYFSNARERWLGERNLQEIDITSFYTVFDTNDMKSLAKVANFIIEILQVFKELK